MTQICDGRPVAVRDLEHENKVLAGALADAEVKVDQLQRRLELLEAMARPLNVRLSRSLPPS
jgi:hypothetical protein